MNTVKKIAGIAAIVFYLLMFALAGRAQDTKTYEYPITRAAMLQIVTIDVNGEPRNFVVDTGAQITLITPAVAGKPLVSLRAASNGTATGSGVGGTTTVIYAKVNIAVGGLDLKDFNVVIIPGSMDKLSQATGMRIDGLLAQDILGRFGRVIFDNKTGKMVLESK